MEKSLAFGFVSHNDRWGADFTAHHACQTCGQPIGYAYAKANVLLSVAPLPSELEIPDEIAVEIFHEIVENAVDILVKRTDPLIGDRLSSAAQQRSPRFPQLLVRAYAKRFASFAGITELEAAQFIQSEENDFREAILSYGQILSQDEATAIQLISEQTANLAQGFLALYGITLPLPSGERLLGWSPLTWVWQLSLAKTTISKRSRRRSLMSNTSCESTESLIRPGPLRTRKRREP